MHNMVTRDVHSSAKKYLDKCIEEKIIRYIFMKLTSNTFMCRKNNFYLSMVNNSYKFKTAYLR